MQKVDDTIVNAYLGVPFAKPPLKSKRFLLPEMVEPWKLWMATSPSPSCYSTPDSVFPNFPGAEMWNPPNKTVIFCLEQSILHINHISYRLCRYFCTIT